MKSSLYLRYTNGMEPTTLTASESLPITPEPVDMTTITQPLLVATPISTNYFLVISIIALSVLGLGAGGTFIYAKYVPASPISRAVAPIFEKIGLMDTHQLPLTKENSSSSPLLAIEATSTEGSASTSYQLGVVATSSGIQASVMATTTGQGVQASTTSKKSQMVSVGTISDADRNTDLKTVEAFETHCTERYGDTNFCGKEYLLVMKSIIKDYTSLIVKKPGILTYAISVTHPVGDYEYESPRLPKSSISKEAIGYYCSEGSIHTKSYDSFENGISYSKTEVTGGVKIPSLEDGTICDLNAETYPLRTCEENLILYKKCNTAIANNKDEYASIEKIKNKYFLAIWGMQLQ